MKGLAAIVEAVLAGRGIDRHAADGIAHGCGGVGVMIVIGMAMTGVIVAAAAGAVWPRSGARVRSRSSIRSGLETYTL